MKIKILKNFAIGSPPVAFQAGTEVESEDKTLIALAQRGQLCEAVEEAAKTKAKKAEVFAEAKEAPKTKGGKS